MPEPIYSIIVPAYNRARSLPEALDSVLAQTCPDWECIVVDDGSTDNTPEVVAGYLRRDRRFRSHRQENAGTASARNRGIALARGLWIAFLDSDDKLLPWALGCYRHASRCLPGADIVVGRIAFARTPVRPPDVTRLPVRAADYLPGSPGGEGHFFIHSVAVRASILRALPCFDESLSTGEDSEFLLRVRAVGEAAVVAWPVALLRQSAGGKYARNIATGRRLEAELAMYRRYPDQPLVRARVAEDAARDLAVRRSCSMRVQLLEIARLLREERFAEAAAAFAKCGSGEVGADEMRGHAARWFDHLFFPISAPWQAGLRFSSRMRGLASALRERGDPGDARFVEEFALACVLYESWRRVFHARDAGGVAVLLAGLLHCHRPRAAAVLPIRALARTLQRKDTAKRGCVPPSSPTVAVIIATYNRAHYLRETIRSVLGQTRPADEVIVVDDGSTDDTAAVCAGFPGIRYLHQPNGGQASARNRGLQAAASEFVWFLDDDDLLVKDAIERQLAVMAAHPDTDLVYGRTLRIDGAGKMVGEDLAGHHLPRGVAAALFAENFVRIQTVITRRAVVLAAGGFDREMVPCEDYDLWLRLAIAGRTFRYLPRFVAYYRIHPGSVSCQHERMARTSVSVAEKSVSGLASPWAANAHYRLGYLLLELGRRDEALHELQAAVRRHPRSWRYRCYATLADHPLLMTGVLPMARQAKRSLMSGLIRLGLAEQRWGE